MTDLNQKPYLLGRKCEGRAPINDPSYFRLTQLTQLAMELKLSPIGLKAVVCQRIRDHLDKNPSKISEMIPKYGLPSVKPRIIKKKIIPVSIQKKEQSKQKKEQIKQKKEQIKEQTAEKKRRIKAYHTLEEMMRDRNVKDIRSLVDLSDAEIEQLIDKIDLHDKTVRLADVVAGKKLDEKIKILVEEMARKLCRCIKDIEEKQPKKYPEGARIGICTSKIFHTKGITRSGFICDPAPVLFPKKGTNAVILHYKPDPSKVKKVYPVKR